MIVDRMPLLAIWIALGAYLGTGVTVSLSAPAIQGTASVIDGDTIEIRGERIRLDAIDAAVRPEDVDIPGFNFHPLRGKPQRYTVHVNAPRCITFEFEDGDAYRVDFEQYH